MPAYHGHTVSAGPTAASRERPPRAARRAPGAFSLARDCVRAPQDLGHFNVELHNPEMKTPHLVEFRKAGLLLDRHYTYKYCSPTRVSIMSGRLPIHVKEDNDWVGGVPRNMTIIAAVLKRAGYATHQIGKWHAGAASHGHVPAGRGFDTSLGYLHCCEDHFSQKVSGATDYWKTQEPAYGLNGTGSGEAGDGAGYCTYNYVVTAPLRSPLPSAVLSEPDGWSVGGVAVLFR